MPHAPFRVALSGRAKYDAVLPYLENADTIFQFAFDQPLFAFRIQSPALPPLFRLPSESPLRAEPPCLRHKSVLLVNSYIYLKFRITFGKGEDPSVKLTLAIHP